jgi:hypothetical protein
MSALFESAEVLYGPRRPRSGRSADFDTMSWRGLSGRLYPSRSFSLTACPAPARAAYLLVVRTDAGAAKALYAGAAIGRAPTLNLARIRFEAATRGAQEVHLIDLAHVERCGQVRRLVIDLRRGLQDGG